MAEQTTAVRIAQGLAKIGLVLRQNAWQEAGGRNLTPTQAQILNVLGTAASPLGVTAVAEALAITAATASDSVRVLVAKGLVRKRRSSSDGRAVRLQLTARGRSEAHRLAGWPELLMQAIDDLEEHEHALFLRTLVKMIRNLQERHAIPVQRMCVDCRFFAPNVYDDPDKPHHCHYVDGPFGDGELRLDCPDHKLIPLESRQKVYALFVQGQPAATKRGQVPTFRKGAST